MSDGSVSKYRKHGFKLVRVKPNEKAACDKDWPEHEHSGDLTGYNIGINHGLSNTCCFDIDDLLEFKKKYAKYWELIQTGLQWSSGKPNRLKVLFRLKPGQTDMNHHPFPSGMGSFQANRHYDVLPPSVVIDDKTGERYEYKWSDGYRDPPELPALLAAEFKGAPKEPRSQASPRDGHIQLYNEWAEKKGVTFDEEIMKTGQYDRTLSGYLRKGAGSGKKHSIYAYPDGHYYNFSTNNDPKQFQNEGRVDLYDLLVLRKYKGNEAKARKAVCGGKISKKLKLKIDKLNKTKGSQNTIIGDISDDFYTFDELVSAAKVRPDYLAVGFMEKGTSNVWSGASEAGKSFLALDFGLRIATGKEWMNSPTIKKGVIYIPGEGIGGIKRRVRAWSERHKISIVSNFLITKKPVILSKDDDAEDIDKIIKRLKRGIKKYMPDGLGLIIWDTAATLFQINENSAEEVGKVLQNAARIAKELGDAATLIIHHTGLEAADRARGSSAWKANVDNTELIVTRNDTDGSMLSVFRPGGKSKDGEKSTVERIFKMERIKLFKEEGPHKPEVVTLVPSFQGAETPSKGNSKKDENKLAILDYLREHSGWHTKAEIAKMYEMFGYSSETAVYNLLKKDRLGASVESDKTRGFKYIF